MMPTLVRAAGLHLLRANADEDLRIAESLILKHHDIPEPGVVEPEKLILGLLRGRR